ncbi:MAG: aminoacyl-tRNA hydrolase [Candidatus Omnitrophica bacterium CG11_big_fil_rev_8_21_14_0_20_42_13]|uniref:Peptidyl-tRNA hydrolase n=1 Tax=Candidatus Ghiorseimicrobium undicola TaxID=1974746 RepID=A0A2H0M1L4_9BACT|nr:MAG: aminoacyl-tRNA hydrolase [Candidatus Omnitrophica bacterium CG11_big_fil_rev_8_21_14_0_20_42_13]
MKLIVGLGNPGYKYENSWHNLGRKVVKCLARDLKCSFKRVENLESFIAKTEYKGEKVLLALPDRFMNLSGRAVRIISEKKNIQLCDMLIVFDDIDINFGAIKIKHGGASAGHRGVESIIERLGSSCFSRLRIGIKTQKSGDKKALLSDYVLSNLDSQERDKFKDISGNSIECIKIWITGGVKKAMNDFNKKIH